MKLRKFTAFLLMFFIFTTISTRKMTVQAYEAFVSNEIELYNALRNPTITQISFLNDIYSYYSSYDQIEGEQKNIDGKGYNWHIEAGNEGRIIFYGTEATLKNMKLRSSYPIQLEFGSTGVLDNVTAPELSVKTRSSLSISYSKIASLDARSGENLLLNYTEFAGKGIYLHGMKNIQISDVSIYGEENQTAFYVEDITGVIENTYVHGGKTGIMVMGYHDDLYIRNTTIENSLNYGLHNIPSNSHSTVHLDDVTIRNTGSYGIYNEQTMAGEARIINENTSVLRIENKNVQAIHQKKAHFENRGIIEHIGNSYTLLSDKKSTLVDENASMTLVEEDDFYSYYQSSYRTGNDIIKTSRDVKTYYELKNALENPLISTVILKDDIVIPAGYDIRAAGLFKEIEGSGMQLQFHESKQLSFVDATIIRNLNIVSLKEGDVELDFLAGGLLENVEGEDLRIDSSGKLLVTASKMKEIVVHHADESRFENTVTVNGPISIMNSKGVLITKSLVSQEPNELFGIQFFYSDGIVKDTKITGGRQGILIKCYLDKVYLENLTIHDSRVNGIANYPQNADTWVYLKNIEITGSGSNPIINERTMHGRPYLINEEGSLLSMENHNGFAIIQKEGTFENHGNIITTDGIRVVTEDLSSKTEDTDQVLFSDPADAAPGTRSYMLRTHYVDTKSPTIVLNGREQVYLDLYEEYVEEGIIGVDEFDGEITSYSVEGVVDTSVAGTYELLYTIRDDAGNKATAMRSVVVKTISLDYIGITLDETQYKYTGEPLTPEPVLIHNERRLVKDQDYTIIYQNNTEPGLARIYITGKGNYTGSAMIEFKILPDVSLSVISGDNRFSTAAYISQSSYENADIAILVQSNNFPDALSAGPLAYALNAPILLTNTGNLSKTTESELKRLRVKKVVILGGTSAISAHVENILKNSYQVERIEGSNRYNTAVATGRYMGSFGRDKDTVVLASGISYADALSAGSYASKNGLPILLTKGDVISKGTAEYLKNEHVKNVIIVGGNAVVSTSVETHLKNLGLTVKRISGSDRFSTSSAIVSSYFKDSTSAVVANGMEYADALAAAPYAAKNNAPIILVQQGKVSKTIETCIIGSEIKDIIVVGGEAAVGKDVKDRLHTLLLSE